MAFNRGPKIVTDGLVLALDAASKNSYPGSGTVWTDLSGNGYTGTLTNSPTFNSANFGFFTFNGTNQYTTTTYSQPAYGTATSFTWNIWVNPGTAGNLDSPIIGNRTGATWTKLTRNTFEYAAAANFGPALTTNVWQNICIVKNGTNFSYYKNSIVIATATSSATQVSRPFFVGGDNGFSEYFGGDIANVQVYNRALSATEISQNFNATKSRFNL
jgi:hypothetical protein